MTWLALSLATPFLFSLTNFIEKFLIEKRIRDPMAIVVLGGFIYGAVGIAVLLVHGFTLLPAMQILTLIASGMLLILYLIPYFKALALDDTSRVLPLFQATPLFVLVISTIFLHEVLTSRQLIGFAVITVAGFMLGTEHTSTGWFRPRPAFWYAMGSSFLYALIGILFKVAVVPHDFWLTIGYQALGSGVAAASLLIWPSIRRSFTKELHGLKRDVWGILLINKTCEILADLAYTFAVTIAPVALVTVVGSVQWIFLLIEGIILSVWFPHIISEDIRPRTIAIKIISILCIAGGIYLISV